MPATSSQPVASSRIRATFSALRAKNHIALMPFIPAGYPDLPATAALIPALANAGASAVEIGFPFSDPIADGPVIQAAFTEALKHNLRVADIFQTVAAARPHVSIPLVAMVSYSIVYRYGLSRFCGESKLAGIDGLILPDLPPPEAQSVCKTVWAAGLDTCLLIAPTTEPSRRAEIASLCTGFIYYLSLSGITGERANLPADLERNCRELRQLTDKPICVGFGISKPQHVAQLAPVADGAIVGSALVKRITEHAQSGPAAIAQSAATYCHELLSQVR